MSELVDAARTIPAGVWAIILLLGLAVWFSALLIARELARPVELETCESCGAIATVELTDGSFWCGDCDAGARNFGDTTPTARRDRIRDCARSWGAAR